MAYVSKKKPNIYYKKSDGTYYYDKMIKGNRFYGFGFKTQKEAEEAMNLDLLLYKNGTQSNLTFLTLLLEFEKYLNEKKSFTTVYNQMKYIYKHIAPFFEKYTIKTIQYRDLQNWKNHFLKENEHLTDHHKNTIIILLKEIFEFVEHRYHIDTGYKNIITIRNNDITLAPTTWDEKQFNQFLSVVDDYKYMVLFHFMFYYGVRLGEVLGLKFKNVDFKTKQISIVSQVVNNRKEHNAVDTTLKTKTSYRTFYIDNFTLDLMQKLYSKKQIYVFGNKDKPLGRNTVRKRFNKYIEKSGVEKIVIHSLRRSCSTRLYNLINDVKSIGQLLGHSEETMTLHYIQARKDNNLKMLQEMENSIKKDNKIYDNLRQRK